MVTQQPSAPLNSDRFQMTGARCLKYISISRKARELHWGSKQGRIRLPTKQPKVAKSSQIQLEVTKRSQKQLKVAKSSLKLPTQSGWVGLGILAKNMSRFLTPRPGQKVFMAHLRNDMSENDSSHIDMVADSVGSDMCHYLWVQNTGSINIQ